MEHLRAVFAIDDDHRAFGALDNGAAEDDGGACDVAGNLSARAPAVAPSAMAGKKALALQTHIVRDHRH